MATDFFLRKDLVDVKTKNEALESLALFLSDTLKANTEVVLKNITIRENLMNTGLEKGIAIPHAIIPNLAEAHIAIITFKRTVNDWFCVDGTKVSKLISLVLPENYDRNTIDVSEVIQLFSSLADDKTIDSVSSAKDSQTIVNILKNYS